jgi:hypothetical protein
MSPFGTSAVRTLFLDHSLPTGLEPVGLASPGLEAVILASPGLEPVVLASPGIEPVV